MYENRHFPTIFIWSSCPLFVLNLPTGKCKIFNFMRFACTNYGVNLTLLPQLSYMSKLFGCLFKIMGQKFFEFVAYSELPTFVSEANGLSLAVVGIVH